MADYLHKILNNPKGIVTFFDGSRGFENTVDKDDEPEETVKDYDYQKRILGQSLDNYTREHALKYQQRTIQVPFSIDYIRIDFLVTFDNFGEFETKDTFKMRFGLNAIQYYNFNKSVLFEVDDAVKFNTLIGLINAYVNSPRQQSPTDMPYHIVTIISDFQFLSRRALLVSGASITDIGNSVVLQLTMDRNSHSAIERQKATLERTMLAYIEQQRTGAADLTVQAEEKFLTLNEISKVLLFSLIDNFDIIASVQAIRIPRIHTTTGGQRFRAYDFDIDVVSENVPLVAIIDNGVNQIPPLAKILANFGYSFDPAYGAYKTIGWHGTAVAVIAACGDSFFKSTHRNLKSDARIVSYRIFENDSGKLDFVNFEKRIRDSYNRGVRIFNLSLNVGFKPYNGDYSYFSFLLDKLSYELDILIFISAGNLDGDDLNNIYKTMLAKPYNDMLDYPRHFFYPNNTCDEHSCDGTNLKVPGESLNNLTVGAIAENFETLSRSDMTLDKSLPAYYTSKYHVSAFHKVNGSRLKQKHINNRLVKPDVIYPGGDYGDEDAGIQLTGSGIGVDFFRQDCGTSFATPFATNLAAKLARQYPTLNMQSIKALIINSAEPPTDSLFLDAHCARLKEEFSQSEFGKTYAILTRSEKLKVNKWFHKDELFCKLIGHGMPNTEVALSSNRKTVTVIVEDTIAVGSHKAIPIYLPRYLNQFSKSSTVVDVQATLCFKFQPNFKDQTGYNPLHMSFNFIKSYTLPEDTAKYAAYRDGLPFYDRLFSGQTNPTIKTKLRNAELGVKTNIQTWSDDFYPNGRQFSNCQKLSLLINKKDLNKVDNNLSLVLRCTGKRDADFDNKNYLSGRHPFSIVLTFSEKAGNELSSYDFYREFMTINQTLDIATQANLDTALEADI